MHSVQTRDLKLGLKSLRNKVLKYGYVITTKTWQGKENPPSFLEISHASLMCPLANSEQEASQLVKASQPWALEHFKERVSGIPYNPPPSHSSWLKDTDKYFSKNNKFSHTYPERLWGNTTTGIRFKNANLNSAIELLKKDPETRQCYIPIWFPEDLTAANLNERVPCTFGWHFMKRRDKLHCSYHMRSCDAVRHLHNDLYLANCLGLWLIEQSGINATMGNLHFSATSLHCFENDKYALLKLVTGISMEKG